MNKTILVIVFGIIFYFLFTSLVKQNENFYGMSYIQEHEYRKCCAIYGCNARPCRIFLRNNKSKMILSGFIYTSNGKNKYRLYKRFNYNNRRYEYLYNIRNKFGDSIFRKIPRVDYLMNNQKINIRGKQYIISLYSNSMVHMFNRNRFRY